jgi:hypothetical protein
MILLEAETKPIAAKASKRAVGIFDAKELKSMMPSVCLAHSLVVM